MLLFVAAPTGYGKPARHSAVGHRWCLTRFQGSGAVAAPLKCRSEKSCFRDYPLPCLNGDSPVEVQFAVVVSGRVEVYAQRAVLGTVTEFEVESFAE